ncbi:MAG TPA: hypothetical protein VKD72_25005 [Gemmataceae bacterium]|nr:hypothetical protein [Gemmataceae bacterium]
MAKYSLPTVLGACALVLCTAGRGAADDATKEKAVSFEQHSGYFESNKSGLKGPVSYLVFTDRTDFDKVFGVAFTMGRRPNILPKDAFKTRMAFAVIKRGDSIWTYKVDKVTAKEGTLTVTYAATSRGAGGTARYASPLIVSVDKGDYSRIVFVENGKTVDTIKVSK